MPNEKSVRALNHRERARVIEWNKNAEFRSELWQRSKKWQRIVGLGFAGAWAYVQFGNELSDAVGRLISILGLK